MGHASGRVAAYSFGDPSTPEVEEVQPMQPPALTRYCSFPSVDAVTQLLPNHSTLMAVGQKGLKIHSQGGVCLGNIKISSCVSTDGGQISAASSFTCADLIRDPSQPRNTPGYIASSVLAGSSDKGAYLFDLSQVCITIIDTIILYIHTNDAY
jgi:hypothetical protein